LSISAIKHECKGRFIAGELTSNYPTNADHYKEVGGIYNTGFKNNGTI